MPRRMIWLNQSQFPGWACSECAWKFNPSGPLVGSTLQEMTQRYDAERDKEFKSHVYVVHLRAKKPDPPGPLLLLPRMSSGTRTTCPSFDRIALEEPLARIDGERDSILGIHSVVQVIAIPGVVDVHIIVIVPVV